MEGHKFLEGERGVRHFLSLDRPIPKNIPPSGEQIIFKYQDLTPEELAIFMGKDFNPSEVKNILGEDTIKS